MLIRSQDKTALIDISGTTIKVFEINSKNFKLIAYGNNNPSDASETLGVYDSKERAIEVLDEIQKSYTDHICWDSKNEVLYKSVYEMPEE